MYHNWHSTTRYIDGRTVNFLVLPPNSILNPYNHTGFMLDSTWSSQNDDISLLLHCTHDIELEDGRVCDRARLKVKCGVNGLLDPFHVHLSE